VVGDQVCEGETWWWWEGRWWWWSTVDIDSQGRQHVTEWFTITSHNIDSSQAGHHLWASVSRSCHLGRWTAELSTDIFHAHQRHVLLLIDFVEVYEHPLFIGYVMRLPTGQQ